MRYDYCNMIHRHLNHEDYTLAAIDDLISRGKMGDWIALRDAVLLDVSLLEKIERVCLPALKDPYQQRYYFWMNYVKKSRATA